MDIAFPAVVPRSLRHGLTWKIHLTYWWRHGRMPDLAAPRTFTELVQARKLAGADRAMVRMADKLVVKQIVTEQLGAAWVIPTLWHGTELPKVPLWSPPFVVKARHGCNQNAFVFGRSADWSAIRTRAARWMRSRYGYWLDEDLYAGIPPGLIVEPFMGTPPVLPIDYKFYVFGGRVEAVQVHLGRGGRHRWIIFDRAWRRLSAPTSDPDPIVPATLARMIAAAETLADGRDFCRVDLYEVEGHPLFGEVTFYPGSGLDPFDPPSLDTMLGAHWLRALGRGVPSRACVGEPIELRVG